MERLLHVSAMYHCPAFMLGLWLITDAVVVECPLPLVSSLLPAGRAPLHSAGFPPDCCSFVLLQRSRDVLAYVVLNLVV